MLCDAVAERMSRSWVVESCRTSVACGGQQAVGVWLQAMGGQTATLRARDAATNCLLLVQALTEAVEGPVCGGGGAQKQHFRANVIRARLLRGWKEPDRVV